MFDQVEAGPAIRLALEGFPPVDLSLDLPVAPGRRHRGAHGVVVEGIASSVMQITLGQNQGEQC